MRRICLMLLLSVSFLSDHAAAQETPRRLLPPEQGVWYEVFVRSFQDTDGDGVGDLEGVRRRLGYLAELGVTGIWLTPIHPSPSYHGYDVSDYLDINPEFGTLEDFRALLAEAHALGIRVILDFVPNHSSSAHRWFKAALDGDPVYRDYYVWDDEPPAWRGNYGGNAWHRSEDSYYLGLFNSSMPDLNHRNPAVFEEFVQIARSWLELGVDGFRVDAIQHVIESASGQTANAPENYRWVSDFIAAVKRYAPEALFVGETWTEMPAIARYHREAGLDMSFNYPLWNQLLAAIHSRSASDLAFTLDQEQALYPSGAWRGTFLSNHDQTRHATQLSLPRRDERRLKLAAALLLTMPGTPFLYYGEEIGMVDGPGSGDVPQRTAMRWDAQAPGYGFTDGDPWTPSGDAIAGVSVAEQLADPVSLLWTYRRLIALRRLHPALYGPHAEAVSVEPRSLLVVRRDGGGETLFVVANLAARAAELDLTALGVSAATDVLTSETFRAATGVVSVDALTLRVLRPE